MNRHNLLVYGAAALFAAPEIVEAKPLRLFHFEVSLRHYDITDAAEFKHQFDAVMGFRHN